MAKKLIFTDEELRKLIVEKQIEILSQHIEHPTKPGYKRHDIIDKIKNLKSEL